MQHSEEPFYGVEILRQREKAFIDAILRKYRDEPASEELKKKIWDELQMEKHKGTLKIPFKIALRKDPSGRLPDYIEVILDTKV